MISPSRTPDVYQFLDPNVEWITEYSETLRHDLIGADVIAVVDISTIIDTARTRSGNNLCPHRVPVSERNVAMSILVN